MKRKGIIIFALLVSICFCYKVIFVTKGQKLEGVIYKSDNLIVQLAKEGEKKKLIVLGTGYSMSINQENKVTEHEPLMTFPNTKDYQEDTTVLSVYFPFESAGLQQAGEELSSFINRYASDYKDIIFIGHSKCGVCFANMARWIQKESYFFTDSTPFHGTPIVNQEEFSSHFNWFIKGMYSIIFSNHQVDKDIGIGSTFLKNANYSGLRRHTHINIVSTCPERTLNPLEILLKYLDKKGEIQGDGIVPKKSQQIFLKGTIQIEVNATHATAMQKAIDFVTKMYTSE